MLSCQSVSYGDLGHMACLEDLVNSKGHSRLQLKLTQGGSYKNRLFLGFYIPNAFLPGKLHVRAAGPRVLVQLDLLRPFVFKARLFIILAFAWQRSQAMEDGDMQVIF